jgi:hypothetical protein
MFVREKTARGHCYLYLVESVRDGGRVRQQIVRALGRKDVLLASGELDRLVASLAPHSERAMILSQMAAFRLISGLACGTISCSHLWDHNALHLDWHADPARTPRFISGSLE